MFYQLFNTVTARLSHMMTVTPQPALEDIREDIPEFGFRNPADVYTGQRPHIVLPSMTPKHPLCVRLASMTPQHIENVHYQNPKFAMDISLYKKNSTSFALRSLMSKAQAHTDFWNAPAYESKFNSGSSLKDRPPFVETEFSDEVGSVTARYFKAPLIKTIDRSDLYALMQTAYDNPYQTFEVVHTNHLRSIKGAMQYLEITLMYDPIKQKFSTTFKSNLFDGPLLSKELLSMLGRSQREFYNWLLKGATLAREDSDEIFELGDS